MRETVLTFFFISAVGCASFAQSSEAIDQILTADALTCGKAAYLLLVASDNIAEDAGDARSFDMLQGLGWIGKEKTAGTPITVSEYAYVVMRAFGMKGSLMYSLLPGPRYAFRELVDRGVIQGRADPGETLTGHRAMSILGRVLDIEEARK
jgi:hypothetical protein